MGRFTQFFLVVGLVACGDDAQTPQDAATPDASAALVLEPASFDFGDVEVGVPSTATHNFVVRNTSTAPVDVASVSVSGSAAAEFTVTFNDCPAQLAEGATCNVRVAFAPTAADTRSASLDVMGPEVASSTLLGHAFVRNARLIFTPGARDFGDLPQGTASDPFTFTVTNELATATFAASLAGPDANVFTIDSTDCNGAIPLHGTCSVTVKMTPPYGSTFVASLKLVDTGTGVWQAGLVGKSSLPIGLSPATGLFGSYLVGQAEQGGRVTYTLTNNGDTTTGTLTPSLIGSDFTIKSTTCTTLSPLASCNVIVELTPTTRGAKTAQLQVTDGTSSARATTRGDAYTVLATGPASFPNTASGQTSAQQAYTIVNASDHATGAVSASITGQFAIASNGCSGALAA
ncbi:MAG TPA: choice-of-anchor D domain-containing protein, partial [Kofleriaceae bacterium]|nr:choice-of-anchor D domain-containing protein [Kofleriaceae bacterium]